MAGPPPSRSESLLHLAKARQNYRLYQQLKRGGDDLDWAVTVLFYAALHLAEAYLVEISPSAFSRPKGREERSAAIRRHLPQIYADYQFLRTRSTWARYHVRKPKPTPQAVQQYETQQFARIVDELRRLGVSLAP